MSSMIPTRSMVRRLTPDSSLMWPVFIFPTWFLFKINSCVITFFTTGSSFFVPVAGFICRLCRKFYHFESSTLHTHCKSLKHFETLKVGHSCFYYHISRQAAVEMWKLPILLIFISSLFISWKFWNVKSFAVRSFMSLWSFSFCLLGDIYKTFHFIISIFWYHRWPSGVVISNFSHI